MAPRPPIGSLPSASRDVARSLGRVAQAATRPITGRRSLEDAASGRTIIVTGASAGIGRATALELGRAGATVLLVARTTASLEDVAREIGHAEVHTADLSSEASTAALLDDVLAAHPVIDVLVNNAGRSIRRSIAQSYDRLHDYERTMRLNYLAPVQLTLGVVPAMRERGEGHVVNVSTLGVQTSPPRFSAYIASKAALDAFTRIAAAECADDGVHFTTVHMPLVRTAMSAPTRLYDRFPALTPQEAAQLVTDAIRNRPERVGPRLGTITEIGSAISPTTRASTCSSTTPAARSGARSRSPTTASTTTSGRSSSTTSAPCG